MTVKHQSNLYVGPVNNFSNFWHCNLIFAICLSIKFAIQLDDTHSMQPEMSWDIHRLYLNSNADRELWNWMSNLTLGTECHMANVQITSKSLILLFSVYMIRCCDSRCHYDDVIKWKHFPRYWPFVRGIHRSPGNYLRKGQWRGALMFSLIFAWMNGWVNTREAGDLRRHGAHYDVSVMIMITRLDWAWNVLNSFPPGQNGRHFADDIFRCIFLNENLWFSVKISFNFVQLTIFQHLFR